MTLTELRYLIALHEHQHFAKAASACHVTQSTLSAGIKHLEESLSTILVERSRHFIRFTPTGESVVQQAQEILSRADDLVNLVKIHDPLQGQFSLGMIYTIAPYLLPHLITPWRKRLPQSPMRLTEGFTHELIDQLNQGTLDAAIIALPFVGTDHFTAWPLYQEPFTLVLPQQHPLTAQTQIHLYQIHDEPLLVLGRGHCFRDHALAAFKPLETEHPWQSLIEGSSLETLRAMVAGGLGMTLLPQLAALQPWPGLVSRPLAEPVPQREVVLIARPSHPRRELFRLLAQTIRDLSLPSLFSYP